MKYAKPLEEYIQFFETLSPRSLKLIDKVVAPGVRFQDPFNDVLGSDEMQRVLGHMFTQVEDPRFKVHDYAWGKNEDTVFLKWTFFYALKSGRQSFEGVSEVAFDMQGKVVSHIDYWDPTTPVYKRIPILGWMISKVISKLEV